MKIKDIKIGSLSKRFALQRRSLTEAGGGSKNLVWEVIAMVWGSLNPITARERFNAMKLETSVTHRVVMRWRPDIKVSEDMRLVLDTDPARAFNIRGVINVEERDRFLDMVVEEGVAQ